MRGMAGDSRRSRAEPVLSIEIPDPTEDGRNRFADDGFRCAVGPQRYDAYAACIMFGNVRRGQQSIVHIRACRGRAAARVLPCTDRRRWDGTDVGAALEVSGRTMEL